MPQPDWNERYRDADTPWDTGEPDVHLVEFVQSGEVKPGRALDVGCGTGVYALALAERGIDVVGADPSSGMLEKARAKAARTGLDVQWLETPMQNLSTGLDRNFDAVVCMGNTLPHVLTERELRQSLSSMAERLTDSGVLVLQLLNYTRVLSRRERIIGVDRKDNVEYVRFYDFLGERVAFNILRLAWRGSQCEHQLYAAELRPWKAEDLTVELAALGLTDIQTCGSLDFTPFDPSESATLMITARR